MRTCPKPVFALQLRCRSFAALQGPLSGPTNMLAEVEPANRWSAGAEEALKPVAQRNGSGLSALRFSVDFGDDCVEQRRLPWKPVTSSHCIGQLSGQWLQECCFHGYETPLKLIEMPLMLIDRSALPGAVGYAGPRQHGFGTGHCLRRSSH